MEMHQIRYFLAAAQTLNFTRAAEDCQVSQPALTTAIKKLESHLGSPLFRRERNQLFLSEFGRRMQPTLARILDQTEAAEAIAQGFSRRCLAQPTGNDRISGASVISHDCRPSRISSTISGAKRVSRSTRAM
jgi:DNA-binding transcriptional LysR family regulator